MTYVLLSSYIIIITYVAESSMNDYNSHILQNWWVMNSVVSLMVPNIDLSTDDEKGILKTYYDRLVNKALGEMKLQIIK